VDVRVFATVTEMGRAAARHGAEGIRAAQAARDRASIILATGTSQYSMLEALAAEPKIDWSRVTAFHLDEYVGLTEEHPASFRRYLFERFVSRVGKLAAFHAVRGDAPDPAAECRRLGELIRRHPIDVAFIGIGENGHLAFNDPPADFETEEPYLVVTLDEACRRQQVGEGWFASLADVPEQAISMGIRQIVRSARLVVTVPDVRKADAVKCAVEGEITNRCPASILRTHRDCVMFLDRPAASKLARSAH
jgi:glucosamine-6-phosphate deaminase